MPLFTSDYLEYYLTLVGWIISNGIWQVVVASGLVALPFAVIVVQEWLRARTDGADEGNKGVLSAIRIETRVWVSILVLMFACVPMIPISLNTIQFDRTRSAQCQTDVALPSETQWDPVFTELNGQSAVVPVWWFFMHSLSKAVTAAAVASIPCGTDLRQMRIDIDATRIDDPVLSQELVDFAKDCYGLARAKLFAGRPPLSSQEADDIGWVGSTYLTTMPGYYDSYRSRAPRAGWPYDEARDSGLPEVPSGGGYPTCREWWSDADQGLRAKLLQQVDPSLLQRFQQWAGFLSSNEVDDAVIRAIAAPRNQVVNQGEIYSDYGGQIDTTLPNVTTRVASDVGLIFGTLAFVPAMDVVRQALPMVLSLIKMALVVCVPLLLVIGLYELKAVVIVSCVQFAVFFVDFFFQLARWLDSTMLDALYGWHSPHSNWNALMGLNNTFGDMILNWFVLGTMFLVLPAFWVSALAWVGVRAGNALQGLADGTRAAGQAGSQGVASVIKSAKS